MTTQSTPAGWYPDPTGKPGQTFWDGQQWHQDQTSPTDAGLAPLQHNPVPPRIHHHPDTPASVNPDPVPPFPSQPMPHYGDPAAPYGRDPVSGRPLSNKSKLAAGVLQFLWGGPFGAGNLYLGDTKLGLMHIAAFWGSSLVIMFGGLVGAVVGFLGFVVMFLGGAMAFGSVAYAWYEAFLIFTDKMTDKDGRQLR
jgi:hypothetical protein